jgi:hypothetical protein
VSGEPTFTYSLKIFRQHQIARCGILGEIALPRQCAAGDCARTATLSVHVAIAAAIVRILRDIRFSLPRPRKRFSIPCACVLRGRHLTSSRDIVRIVDQQRHSRVLNTCPSVSMDGMAARRSSKRKFLDVTTRSRLTAQSRELPEARLIEMTTGIHVQRHGLRLSVYLLHICPYHDVLNDLAVPRLQ